MESTTQQNVKKLYSKNKEFLQLEYPTQTTIITQLPLNTAIRINGTTIVRLLQYEELLFFYA
ncbi:hypothetical protein JCM15579A_10100 [Marinifilum fragile]